MEKTLSQYSNLIANSIFQFVKYCNWDKSQHHKNIQLQVILTVFLSVWSNDSVSPIAKLVLFNSTK